tara:strand:- start:252 stop:743 length:492 start_codon:yes stop_codon:yes gene_type:complete
MNKYRNGKIYKLIDLDSDKVYIGSTIQTLDKRLSLHKSHSNPCMSNTFKDPYIQLIKSYPCNSKRALDKEEQKYIDMYDCVNKNKSFQTKEELKEHVKQYHLEHEEEWKEYKKKYDIINNEKHKKRHTQQFTCECGGKYTYSHKIRHMKSKKHINYLLLKESP